MPTEIWGFVIIGGPILLGLVIAFALYRNKARRSKTSVDVTERAARELREQLDREDASGGS